VLVGLAACGGEDAADSAGGGGHDHDHAEEEASAAAADDSPPAFDKAAATTVVETTLRDYAFVGIPPTVQGPNVFFEATIAGSNTHELEVVDASGASVDEIPPHRKGPARTLAVVLEPGTYTVQCLVKEGTRTHAQLGMKTTLTVQ